MRQAITLETLQTLIEAGTVREALIVPHGTGYAIRVRWGAQELPLRSQREPVRRFASLDTACDLLRDLGLQRATEILG